MRTWRERRKEIKWRWRQKTRSMLATNTVVIHSRASHCLLSELLSLSLNFSLNLFFFSLTQRQVESKRKSFLWTSVYKRKKEVSFNLLSIKMMMMSIAWSCLLYTCIFLLLSCLVFSRFFVSLPSFRASWYTIKFVVPSFYSLSLSLFFLVRQRGKETSCVRLKISMKDMIRERKNESERNTEIETGFVEAGNCVWNAVYFARSYCPNFFQVHRVV